MLPSDSCGGGGASESNYTRAKDAHLHPSRLGGQDVLHLGDTYTRGETVSGR